MNCPSNKRAVYIIFKFIKPLVNNLVCLISSYVPTIKFLKATNIDAIQITYRYCTV